jgi:multiple sugar transport system permease protein
MPSRHSPWRARLGVSFRRSVPAYVLVSPVVLLILLMMVIPTLQTALFSVSRVQLPAMEPTFVGMDNYVRFLSQGSTGALIWRTLFWIVATVVLRFVMGFAAALLFSAAVRGTGWMRILVFIPWAIPAVVAASLWRWVLQTDAGVINDTLRYFGASGLAQNWLGNPDLTLLVVIVAYSWAGFPFVMLLMLAGLQGIPREYNEAAQVDGASSRQVFRYITLPSLSGLIGIVLVLEAIMAINAFDMLFVMAGGGPAEATTIFSLAVFDTVFTDFDYGGASAMSMVLFFVFAVCFVGYGILNARANRKSTRDTWTS